MSYSINNVPIPSAFTTDLSATVFDVPRDGTIANVNFQKINCRYLFRIVISAVSTDIVQDGTNVYYIFRLLRQDTSLQDTDIKANYSLVVNGYSNVNYKPFIERVEYTDGTGVETFVTTQLIMNRTTTINSNKTVINVVVNIGEIPLYLYIRQYTYFAGNVTSNYYYTITEIG